jgi:hypothetical protein
MDVAALIVAIIALLASILSIGWQVYTWQRTRTLDVVVDLSQLSKTHKGLVDDTTSIEEFLTIKVTNRSEFEIKVVGVAVVPNGARFHAAHTGGWISLPRVVKPRDGEVVEIPATTFSGKLPDSLLQAVVELATGEEIRSIPTSVPFQFGGPIDRD